MSVLSSVATLSPFASPRHPAVLKSRRAENFTLALVGLGLLVMGMAVTVAVPDPSLVTTVGLLLGTFGLMTLAVSSRYEITLALLALYLGLLDGFIKLSSNSQAASGIRDVLIAAISLGAIVRIASTRGRIRLPPLSGWVIAFATLVLTEAFNPHTGGLTKTAGGFRQHLEWLPFFFFGFAIMRSKRRFRNFFVILGVIASINGVVSTIQTQLTPSQLATWGPGYRGKIYGTAGVSGRVYYTASGAARVRPPALGSDQGFGGYMGVLALPGAMALLAAGGIRRRSALAILLSVGSLLAIATSEQRTAVLGGVAALAAFAFLSIGTGRATVRAFGAIVALMLVLVAFIFVLGSSFNSEVFSRYSSISPNSATSTTYNYRDHTLAEIPTDIRHFPFGAGLATAGAAAGFGGTVANRLSAESQYNYVTVELGLAGLILWVALTTSILVIVFRSLRKVADLEIRLSLAAVFAAFIAFTLMGFGGPTMSSLPFGPYFWFSVGIASYWLASRSKANPVGIFNAMAARRLAHGL
jgi:hypothetical protein